MTQHTNTASGTADLPEALRSIQRFEVVDCIDDQHVPAVIPKPHGPWVRYEDHIAALAAGQATAAQADSVQEDAARLDFLIEQRAYVVSDPDACPGYWLHWAMPDGRTWVQGDEHPTPRAAIDAARKRGAR